MRGYLPRLFLLAALWGSSYFFIKVGVDDVAPAVLMAGRTLLAGTILLGFVLATRGASRVRAELSANWRQAVVYGIFNAALPFWLIAWGEQHIDSSVAGIAQATVPLFAFVLGIWLLPHEPVARIRWIGVVFGLARCGGAVRTRHVRWVVGRGRDVCDRALVAVLRIRRHLRAAPCPWHLRACARDRSHALRRGPAAPVRDRSKTGRAPRLGDVRGGRGARGLRDGDRPAALLPHASAVRCAPDLARRLSHARLCDCVRGALPLRADHVGQCCSGSD